MKISRLKRGWRIHLTDNEMEALRYAVIDGVTTFDLPDSLSNGARRTLRSARWQSIEGPLTTDDDRREPSSTPPKDASEGDAS